MATPVQRIVDSSPPDLAGQDRAARLAPRRRARSFLVSIRSARPVIEHLRRVGLFRTDDVANQALALVGE